MLVSFGKKIPIMQCTIKDVDKNKKVPALISEYDCKTSEDAQDVINLGSAWHYYLNIGSAMLNKYKNDSFWGEKSPMHFYIMENKSGKPVALCETIENDNEIRVQYIESSHEYGHKYCGKTMLAALGKKLLDNKGAKLTISAALPEAYDFYVKGCGFKEAQDGFRCLQMNSEQVDKFISKTEQQTGGKITKPKKHIFW